MLSPPLVPEVRTAISLLLFVHTLDIGTTTMFALLVGHGLITLPFVFMNVAASLEGHGSDLSMVAQSLGAGRRPCR